MDKQENEDNPSEDTYVFLDFNGKVYNDIFKSQVFMRIANLNEKNPLVQVNDSVFKGTYDCSVGTNLFFEEVEDIPITTSAFEKEVPIHLKHSFSSLKVLNLKPVRIVNKKVQVPHEVSKININLIWDYNVLLKKFENATLHTDAFEIRKSNDSEDKVEAEKDDETRPEEETLESTEVKQEAVVEPEPMEIQNDENTLNNIICEQILESEYEKLKVLARRPVKRAVSPELVESCEEKYVEAYEYHNIERQILRPSDAFQIETVTDIDEDSLSNCVDIDRCVLQGIIQPSNQFPRIFSDKEKSKLFTLENFDNLSLAARYFVLKNHVTDLENCVSTSSKATLQEKDEFGRTPSQTLEIYRKLCDAVMKRLTEIKYSLVNTVNGSDVEQNKSVEVVDTCV